MATSSIEWTEMTWNPTLGCSEQSPGCTNCYAVKMAWRLMHIEKQKENYRDLVKKLPNGRLVWTGKLNLIQERLIEPFLQKKPTMYFVNSMSDLFHPEVPFEFIHKVFIVMALTPQHTYQILTKQPERAAEYFKQYPYSGLADRQDDIDVETYEYFNYIHEVTEHREYGISLGGLLPHIKAAGWFWDTNYTEWGKESHLILENEEPLANVWLGVSVESAKYEHRIETLRGIPAAIRFVSFEPLIGPILPNLDNIHWAIVGGESGNGKGIRPMSPVFVKDIRDICKMSGTAFFFKQWGNYLPLDVGAFGDIAADGSNRFFHWEESESSKYTRQFGQLFYNLGKHKSGALLDGVEHKQFPKKK